MNESSQRDKEASRTMKHNCVKTDPTAKVFLKETSREEKFKLLDHIFSCPECLEEFNVLREVWAKENSLIDADLTQKLEQTEMVQVKSISKKAVKALKREKRSRKRYHLTPKIITAAAAVLVAAVLIIYVAMQNRPEQIPLEREVGSEIFRTIEPEGEISSLPILFRWSPVQGAREYTIEVLDKGLEVVYRKEGIQVASFALPDKIYSQLQVSQTYFWKVIATLDDEKSIESEMGKFTLTER